MSADWLAAPPVPFSLPAAPASGWRDRGFQVGARLASGSGLGRTGTIHTAHGTIRTPAFIPVGTKANVKALTPEMVEALGAQAVLANAYHLYLRPGSDVVDEAGGFARFMNWRGPTYTDSGGFQVLSLGAGFKKVLSQEFSGAADPDDPRLSTQAVRASNAVVDDDGVVFSSHIDGTKHRFTPEASMRIQHQLGADIMFAFDELTTLMNTRDYQEASVARTHRWAVRCLCAHAALTEERVGKPYQALFGVIQGAQYEDLRRRAAADLAALEVDGSRFDGFGLGGALEKENLGRIIGWMVDELPEDRPRHLLGISEPEDLFEAVAFGADTFDCVNPSRVARNAAIYTADGRYNVNTARNRRAFEPLEADCDCYTCTHYTRAYLHHLFKAKEMLASTLATIHNERFTVRLVDEIRASLKSGEFDLFRNEFMGRYNARKTQ